MVPSSHFVVYILVGSTPVELVLASPLPPPLAEQQHAEGLLEGLVAKGIAHGIDCTVNVAQPVAQVPQGRWDALSTEGGDQYHNVVWRPREDECQEDGAESLRCLLLLDQHVTLPLCDLILKGRVQGL